ncbi:hypothetical protein MKZ20_11605 [Psychrobacillus sp. FSL K6-2684]|uniref:Resolvase HTH domain-containing protein n=1 Tax=Psychrobacillus faecigallinarum TaxID=2762235 RepID=A0ABR8R7V4_9BACI|nr:MULTISPECIES: hypothetical protein [Psychrobacillus]MBD7943877.1 hypothetical protein [Psychrobacillus faecigallinarum]QEY19384.1 hypothetical protein D0S48_00970 [Psychrobacillus sp. AK 1817]QGM29877.1 hypothetical protein GI482_05565 [Bacillus sp. N3536]
MDFSIIIIIIGIILMALSFFIKDGSKKVEAEVEDLSFTLYQETSALKRRLKVIEEELLIDPIKTAPKKNVATKPVVHAIIKNQVLELHKQGYSLKDISSRSSLTVEEVKSVIGGTR